jgi:hypothetical protein
MGIDTTAGRHVYGYICLRNVLYNREISYV